MTTTTPHLLVLGGGSFVGAAVVDEARNRGWRVTCLSRGILPLPDDGATITADRTDPTAVAQALAGLRADYIVDTWAGAPSVVAASAAALEHSGARIGYVSTRSVYSAMPDGADETHPTVEADPDAPGRGYAEDKRGGELAWERVFGADRVALFRAGAIVGPRDNHGRLVWWLGRLAEGGQVLAPGPRDRPLQYLDVRDLARFALSALESGRCGPFDTVTESGFATMGSLLEAAAHATHSTAELVWVPADWLLDHGVEPWREVPFWAPAGTAIGGVHTSNPARALAAGLTVRPTSETVNDTWASVRAGLTSPVARAAGLGMSRDRERELLAAWAAR